MHHRRPPAVEEAGALRAALTRCSERLSRRAGALLAAAVALAVLAGSAAVLAPGLGPSGTARRAAIALEAAQRQAPTSGAATPGGKAGAKTNGKAARRAGRAAAPTAAADATAGTTATATADPTATATGDAVAASSPATAPVAAARAARHGDHRRQQPPAQAQADATVNPNCTLLVPADPLSPGGLASPYELVATDPGAGACHEADAGQSAFVEAAIFDPTKHALSIYHPVVVDQGDQPAAATVPVALPAGAVVGVWFGFNGDTLTLGGDGAGSCVNGLPGSPFGQFAYCNAPAFFAAVNADKQVVIPPLGTGTDGLPCPTTRDFAVVDQDQSDNLATAYRIVDGGIAQDTPDTTGGTALTNGSDEGLLAKAIDPALGCSPFMAPDLTNGGAPVAALALNELSAARNQRGPAALVPTIDPMTQVDGATSVRKANLYRAGVDMPLLPQGQAPAAYCAQLRAVAPARLTKDEALLAAAPAPAAGAGDLLAFLRQRLQGSLTMLGCDNQAAPDAMAAPDATVTPDAATATSPAATPTRPRRPNK